jgi:hypothetical protein
MKEEANVQINAAPNQDGELIIRYGQAELPALPPTPLSIIGNLSAPIEYAVKFATTGPLALDFAILLVTPPTLQDTCGVITFISNTNDPYADTVVGKLEFTNPLKVLAINTENKVDLKELIRRLRTVSHYIRGEGFEAVVRRLTSFTAKAQVDMKSEEIRRGKGGTSHFVDIDTDIPATITFCAPWYGTSSDAWIDDVAPLTIDVDVCFDLSGSGATMQFWLDAPWMTDQLFRYATDLMNATVAKKPEGLLHIIGKLQTQ